MEKVVDFLDHLERKNKLKARRLYYFMFRKFAEFVGVRLEELSWKHMVPIKIEECMANLAPRSANALLSAVRSYAKYLKGSTLDPEQYNRFLMFYDQIDENVEWAKVPEIVEIKSPSLEELEEILELIDDDYIYAFAVVIFYLGARPIEISQKFEEKTLDLRNRDYRKGERAIDFDQKLIAIITAKTGVERVIPIDGRVLPYFEAWFDGLNDVLECKRPEEWFTRMMRNRGLPITAKTARIFFETEMRMRTNKQAYINYWIGHKKEVSDIYTDFARSFPKIKEEIIGKHYIFEILSKTA